MLTETKLTAKLVTSSHLREYLEARFLSNTVRNPETGCLEWVGHTIGKGYRRTRVQSLRIMVHRLSWILNRGTIPIGLLVLHSCDNPACCEISHLFLGTDLDNTLDKVNKCRHGRGERLKQSHLRASDIIRIRELSAEGLSNQAIASMFGVTHQSISAINLRQTWRHVT